MGCVILGWPGYRQLAARDRSRYKYIAGRARARSSSAPRRIERSEGALFLLAYAVFLVGLVLEAVGSPWAQPAHQALYFLVAPLAVLVLSLAFWRQFRPSPAVN